MASGSASNSGIRMGRAFVELFTKDKQLTAGLDRAQRRVQAFSAGVTKLGTGGVALGVGMLAPLLGAGKVFADFEQQMAQVATMLPDPSQHLEGFKAGIREMSVEFGESTEALAKGLYDILSASVPAEKAMEVLAVAARAGKAGLTDTGVAADAITTVLNAYGLSADHAGEVSDRLFSVVKRGKLTFAELAPNIGKVATLASSAGVPLDDLGAMIALLTRNGIKTEESMTGIAAVISSFLTPSAEAATMAREMGFEMNAQTLAAEGLQGVMARLAGMPPDVLARFFPNVKALKTMLPALNDVQAFGEDVAAMANGAGATGDAYALLAATTTTAFARMKQAGIGVLSVIGEAINDPLREALAIATDFLRASGDWIQTNGHLARTLLAVAVGLVAAGGTLVAVGLGLGLVAGAMAGLSAIIGLVTGTLGGLVAIVGTVAGFLFSMPGVIAVVAAALVLKAGEIGGAWTAMAQSGRQAIADLIGWFQGLQERAVAAFGGIRDALAAGDIQLAAKILWLTLQAEWMRGTNYVFDVMRTWRDNLVAMGWDMLGQMGVAVANGWTAIQQIWLVASNAIENAITGTLFGLLDRWDDYFAGVRKGWIELTGLFDDDQEVKLKLRAVDQEVAGNKAARANVLAGGKASQEQELSDLAEELAELEADFDQAGYRAGMKRALAREELAASEADDLAALQAEIDAALAQAKAQRETAIAKTQAELGGTPTAKGTVEGPAPPDPIGDMQRAISGSFNARALQGLKTQPLDKLEKPALEQVRLLRRLVDYGRDGVVYG